ncbi:MAG: hypothetical protein H0T78_01740 [Longispora sp.]|nr:hypothetical protein [Longispora sp. (in: high G+C Gram-positive bacteria)]
METALMLAGGVALFVRKEKVDLMGPGSLSLVYVAAIGLGAGIFAAGVARRPIEIFLLLGFGIFIPVMAANATQVLWRRHGRLTGAGLAFICALGTGLSSIPW